MYFSVSFFFFLLFLRCRNWWWWCVGGEQFDSISKRSYFFFPNKANNCCKLCWFVGRNGETAQSIHRISSIELKQKSPFSNFCAVWFFFSLLGNIDQQIDERSTQKKKLSQNKNQQNENHWLLTKQTSLRI